MNWNVFRSKKLIIYSELMKRIIIILFINSEVLRLMNKNKSTKVNQWPCLAHTNTCSVTDITVIGFGSIVTGLAMKGSDLDCLVQLPRWLYPPDKSLVVHAKEALMQRRDIFQHPFAIVNAKVPIVRFFHKPTGISCDLSFTSQAGVENSKLLRYFINSNQTAFKLAFMVKFWSKTHNLTGSNLMPSYCLTLLVIFFLQQIDMLHSVQDLQENTEALYIDGWNTAFNKLEITDRNNKSLYKLLGEFFKYYKSFEFNKYIISPYLGRPIQKELLEKTESVPLGFSLYKNNVFIKNYKPIRLDTVMCVQDPFEHNRNCAVAVHPKLAQKVLAQIQKAASVYELESPGAFLPKLLAPTIDNTPAGRQDKKRRSLLSGVRKHYQNRPRNPNVRQIQQNFRQNHFRGRIQRTWR